MANKRNTEQVAPGRDKSTESAVSPDVIEQSLANEADDAGPMVGVATLPTVALGGSAGSITALRDFLYNVSPSSGLAYVVVLHLDPAHHSTLPELLQQYTRMPVRTVENGAALLADHVYVIPPGKHLIAVDGHLRLVTFSHERGRRTAVDLFFRSLGDTHGAHAVAVVLSGLDGDGAVGLQRIKERGGLTIIQDPQNADYPSMPVSSLETGMVDWVLRPADMPRRIAAYFANEGKLQLPPEQGPQPAELLEPAPDQPEALLREILMLLRSRTGRDFTYYKRATILRRISRRMLVTGVTEMADYLNLLRTIPGEAPALLQDLLISVTNFFRDRTAFEKVESLIPELFQGKEPGESVRVWCVACASGEEAYSMAMLLLEHAATLEAPPALQVFGCDLDERAIQAARAGFYPDTISADVSEERLRRFFNKEPGGWRVRRELREMVLFTPHDIFKDAPFSRMDLVSCRNLMIYLDRSAHARLLDLFHFALRPDGLLFLGTSESIDEGGGQFESLDKPHRLYRHQPAYRPNMPVSANFIDGALSRVIRQHERLKNHLPLLPTLLQTDFPAIGQRGPVSILGEDSAREVHFKLVDQYGPASVVVDADLNILHASDTMHPFLRVPGGEPTRNFLKLVHPALRIELRAALLTAHESQTVTEQRGREVVLGAGLRAVDIKVVPVPEVAPGAALVLLSARAVTSVSSEHAANDAALHTAEVVQQIERELTRTKTLLRDAQERHQESTAEFEASNKELQAVNEELRSTGEELETGREELQSVNEELITLNADFRSRAEELVRSNSDLQNLMTATQIATVFLDRELKVMGFTPSAAPLFNLIATDVGRPIAHLNTHFEYVELAADAEQVLRTLMPVERELQDGAISYLVRLLPYRTVDDRIAGVVLSFLDFTERRRVEDALRASEARFRLFVNATSQSIYRMDADWTQMLLLDGKNFLVDATNPTKSWLKQYIPKEDQTIVQAAITAARQDKRIFELEHRVVRADGSIGWAFSRAIPFVDDAGNILEWFGAATDITARKEDEARQALLLALAERLRATDEPGALILAASEALGRHLGVGRCGYGAVDASGEQFVIEHEWDDGAMASAIGSHRCSDFGEAFIALHRAGRIVMVDDVRSDALTRDSAAAFHAAGAVRASLAVQIMRGGLWIGSFYLQQSTPRHWTADDAQLLREVADQTWAAAERARAEAALRISEASLREAEARQRLAIEASDLATWEWDFKTDECQWNERHFRIFDLEPRPGPVMAQEFFERVHDDDRARVDSEIKTAIGRRRAFHSEFRIVKPDGSIGWMSGYGRVVSVAADGEPLKMSGVMHDITRRKEAEEELRANRERLDLIVENVHDYAIVTMDLDRRIMSWNVGAEAVIGHSQDEAVGELIDLIFTPEDLAAGVPQREAGEALTSGRAIDERWHVKRDGTRFWGSGVMTAMHDVNGTVIGTVKIFRDQTAELLNKQALERSRLELAKALQEMEIARDDAEAAGAAKDRFLAVLSHELRTPLTPLLLTAQRLARNTALPPKVLSALAVIERNAWLETRLVDDLLDVTRISTGKMQLEHEPTSLGQIVALAAEVVTGELEAKRQTLTIQLAEGKDTVTVDAKRVQQVVWNLLRNAIKFSPAESRITLLTQLSPERAVIQVRDEGIGFNEGAEQRIFAAFEQENVDVTRRFGGLGLGLAIAKAIVDAHGGSIHAESPGAGQGATFSVELPRVLASS